MNAYLALMAATSLAFSVAPVAARPTAASTNPGTMSSVQQPAPVNEVIDVRDATLPAFGVADAYDWTASGVAPAPMVWPADEPVGHFMVLAMILPLFLMLCSAIFVVNFAYRSARAQTRRERITYRARTSASRASRVSAPNGARVALLHIG